MRFRFIFLGKVILLLLAAKAYGDDAYEQYKIPAVFKITNEIVGEQLRPFSATIEGFGNSLLNQGSGFEPIIYRNMYVASEAAPNSVIAPQNSISHWDTLKSGALDKAEISVYRIENGTFRHVRDDMVRKNGFHASGWRSLVPKNRIISATNPFFEFQWSKHNRIDAQYFFTVRAVDTSGNLSKVAQYLRYSRPSKLTKIKIKHSLLPNKKKLTYLSESAPLAPSNFRGKIDNSGVLKLNWDSLTASNIAGYIVYISDTDPEEHKGFYLMLENEARDNRQKIKKGDLVFVRKKIYAWSRNKYLTNRVWGARSEYRKFLPRLIGFFPDEDSKISWNLERYTENTPVEDSGETYLSLNISTTKTISLGMYNHSGIDQYWYDVLEETPYIAEVWIKKIGIGKVQFRLKGQYEKGVHAIKASRIRPDSEWKKYTVRFVPTKVLKGKIPNQMVLEFNGPAIFHIDNFRIYRADSKFLDYHPRDYTALAESGVKVLRTHGLIKTKTRTYDLEQLTNPGGVITGSQKSNSLHQTLTMMKKAEVDPWLQIEPHLTSREWEGFVEYLAASFDSSKDSKKLRPWAHKRFTQGQKVPWVDEFDTIYLELGNETWNRLFYPWSFTSLPDAENGKKYTSGEVYGMFQEHIISILKKSPHWSQKKLDSKIKFVLGGWGGVPSFSLDAVRKSPSSDYLMIAGYNGGWDEKEGPPDKSNISFFNVLNQVSQGAIPVADKLVEKLKVINLNRKKKIQLGTYEAGPGYALNGLNNVKVSKEEKAEQEQVMKSLAAGTATIDSFLARTYREFTLQNYFTFGRGDYWKSHAKWYHGQQAYPSWMMISLFNNKVSGTMVQTITESVPTIDLAKFKRRIAVRDAPLVAVYAIKNEDQYAIFVISRKVPYYPHPNNDGFTPVTLKLPFTKVESIKLYKMEGDIKASNIDSEQVKLSYFDLPVTDFSSEFEINSTSGASNTGLPPGSTYLYIFKKVSG